MNKITEITKRDIFELFINGYNETIFSLTEKYPIKYYYYGRLDEIEFLCKLYPLNEMPSNDNRFENARDDIFQHTVNNDDWDFG